MTGQTGMLSSEGGLIGARRAARNQRIMKLYQRGLAPKDIARREDVSIRTVYFVLTRLAPGAGCLMVQAAV